MLSLLVAMENRVLHGTEFLYTFGGDSCKEHSCQVYILNIGASAFKRRTYLQNFNVLSRLNISALYEFCGSTVILPDL